MEQTVFLNTTREHFLEWLQYYIHHTLIFAFPKDDLGSWVLRNIDITDRGLLVDCIYHLNDIKETWEEPRGIYRSLLAPNSEPRLARGAFIVEMIPLSSERIELVILGTEEVFSECFNTLVRAITDRWPTTTNPADGVHRSTLSPRNEGIEIQDVLENKTATQSVSKQREAGPTVKVQERFVVFKKLKDANPTWTYARLAIAYFDEIGEYVSSDTVKNAYISMGEHWQRGDRIRKR